MNKRTPGNYSLAYWKCICDCGKVTTVCGSNLKRGYTASCGCCLRKNKNKDTKTQFPANLTGLKFGTLTVVKEDNDKDKTQRCGHKFWLCNCDCGRKNISVSRNNLIHGQKSCGCKKSVPIDLTGMRFGKFTVLKIDPVKRSKRLYWICKCDCGTIKSILGQNLRNGRSCSCGCDKTSKGSVYIKNYLESHDIKFQQEFRIKDCKNINPLPFDFALFNQTRFLCLIEYQGEQHYKQTSRKWKNFGTYEREITDPIKRNYCNQHSIPLYEIRYDENIEQSLNKILKEQKLI